MTDNASHVVVHHYYGDSSDARMFNMTCCIVLSVIIVLILIIILAFIIYIILQRTKSKPQVPPMSPSNLCGTVQNTARTVSNSHKRDVSNQRNASNSVSLFNDPDIDINSNVQNIPMSTLRVSVEDRIGDSTLSSAGLCDVLFPPKHDGEVIYEPPPKVVAYAGQVFETPRRILRINSTSAPVASGSGTQVRNSGSVNTSMEWDYYESKRYDTSDESDIERKRTLVCWV